MSYGICSNCGQGGPIHGRGLCYTHWLQWRATVGTADDELQQLADLIVERDKLARQLAWSLNRLNSQRSVAQVRGGNTGETPFFGPRTALQTEDPYEDRELDDRAEKILMGSRELFSDDDWLSIDQVAHRQAREVYCPDGYPDPLIQRGIYGRAYNPAPPHRVSRFSDDIDPWDQDMYEFFRSTPGEGGNK